MFSLEAVGSEAVDGDGDVLNGSISGVGRKESRKSSCAPKAGTSEVELLAPWPIPLCGPRSTPVQCRERAQLLGPLPLLGPPRVVRSPAGRPLSRSSWRSQEPAIMVMEQSISKRRTRGHRHTGDPKAARPTEGQVPSLAHRRSAEVPRCRPDERQHSGHH